MSFDSLQVILHIPSSNMYLLKTLVIFSTFLFTEGYHKDCDVNETLILLTGGNATFVIGNFTPRVDENTKIEFAKTDSRYERLLLLTVEWHSYVLDVDYTVKSRTTIYPVPDFTQRKFTIVMSEVTTQDNGIYAAYLWNPVYRILRKHCWTLLTKELKQIPPGQVNENEAIRILVLPSVFVTQRHVINATVLWLLDGHLLSETKYFAIQQDEIWTVILPRTLNGRNVSYREVHDSGEVNEMNLTLDVAYGPDFPLALRPNRTLYTVKAGDMIPDIECTADCNPPCSVTWDQRRPSPGILSLGSVSASTSGEYVCTAKSQGNGTRHVERSIYVLVTDNTTEKIAFACLGSVLGVTTLCFAVFAVCFCVRGGNLTRQRGGQAETNRTIELPIVTDAEHRSGANGAQNNVYPGNYEALNVASRQGLAESDTYSGLVGDSEVET